MSDWLVAPLRVISVLELLDVQYVIGGSVATLVHGIPRFTNDIDIIVNFNPENIEPFVCALEQEFYVDREAIKGALKHHGSFNLLHYDTMFKVDIFFAKDRSFDRAQLSRRVLKTLSSDSPRQVYVLTAEDNIVAKLEWYRMAGEVSERQWSDVLGIMKTKLSALDIEYMRKAAESLDVTDLLNRALAMSAED
ncbi:MAG: hypothetical protein SGJ27_23270 [Candidatus Melainabacteria bacterium]|nr:hypothetical protein [Candidatus Melainabacteria bacterium]